ncbi:AAA family ATPase [Spiractinospora alimapuensis]|uniref:AAA family ATPase n=1 Tax=Spiractinospora alimapuensis TaxID=2820884 RepID=UPI001F43888D|nr:AAA family ATPase [Spiractinospora alimapuensis]QVQ51996.1 AAA family ATPase [Spiractinospora alimapuensis]
MARDERPRTTEVPSNSAMERMRVRYSGLTLGGKLAVAGAVLVAVAVAALFADVALLPALLVTAVVLGVVAALMRFPDAVGAVGVSLVWIVIAHVVFQISLGYASSWILVLALLPLPVALIASRIPGHPTWHTTLLSLACALIVGLASVVFGMAVTAVVPDHEGVPPAAVVILAFAAAGVVLVWRGISGRHLAAEERRRRQRSESAGGADPTAPGAPAGSGQSGADPSDAGPAKRKSGRTATSSGERQRERAGSSTGSTARGSDDETAVPVDEALAQLEAMVGLDPVKQQVRSLAAAIEAARLRADAGMAVEKPLRHLVFSGPPGTGKTSVARTIATIFHSFGLLPSAQVVEVQRADLVGEYLGATAIRTNEVIDRALGGVLFIDEAYALVNSGDGQPDRFGQEAVQTLLKRAEDDRDQLVVILAGYSEEMDRFLASNPGLASRFSTRVRFPGYTPDELIEISEGLFEQRGDELDDSVVPALRQRFDQAAQLGVIDDLGNGRFVRSLVERAAEARDVRVVTTSREGQAPAPEELVTVRDVDAIRAFEQLTEALSGYSKPPDLEEALAELDAMVGLEPVKRQVRSMTAQLRLARIRQERGLHNQPPMRHFVFVGPPGTGKTTVARVLGRIFAALGLLTRAEVVEASRADLVGEHLGATAIKTNKLIDSAVGGVLFVDEAYALSNPGYSGGDAFGAEAIQTLLKRAEDDRSRLVVVLAGYPDEMDRFLSTNSGLASRFNVRVSFPSYSPEELLRITETLAEQRGDTIEDRARDDLRQVFGYVCSEGWVDTLGNGRFARSLFEKACSARDLRVAEDVGDAADQEDLTVVTSADLREAYSELTQR